MKCACPRTILLKVFSFFSTNTTYWLRSFNYVCRDFPSSCSYLLTGARRRRWDYYLSRIWWRMAARSAYDSLHTLTWWCWEKRERWCLALAFDDWLYWIPNNYYYAILLRSSQAIILHAIIDDRTNDRYYVVVVRSIDLIFWFDSSFIRVLGVLHVLTV